jgi:hypothetical protein
MDVEDLEVYKKLCRLYSWQLAEETAVYGVKNESFPQGWPITTEHVS